LEHPAHPDAELTQTQLQELAEQLADKRHDLTAALDELNQQIAVRDDCSVADAAEAASLQEGRVRAGGVADQHRQTITDIDAALARVKNGQYGVSTLTGEPISYVRLALLPWARTGANE
jgi:DnaK suppressor protein